MKRSRLLAILPWIAAALAQPEAVAAADSVLFVYLPSAPVESASRLGEAVTELGDYLNREIPGLGLRVRPFRRSEDAAGYLAASSSEIALVLSDSAFLLDLPAGFSAVPTTRFVRSLKETQRKVVVVAATNTQIRSLADLKGASLSLALSGGAGTARFLARVVFDGAIPMPDWFSKVITETDEFTAAANVLFGKSDAALVSEDNPFLLSHLGKDLKAVFTSPAISLPVLAYRTGALSGAQLLALDTALEALSRRPEGRKIFDGLKIDTLARIREGSGRFDRAGLLTPPQDERRVFEIATASLRDFLPEALPAPAGGKLMFQIGFRLPDLPMPQLQDKVPQKERKPADSGGPP